MKIVFFIDHLRGDGTQRVLSQLTQSLATRGYEQAVVCLNNSRDEALVTQLRLTAAEVRIVGKAALLNGYGLWSTWQWLRRERFDAAVTMLFFADVVGRLLANWSGVTHIISSIRARNIHYSFLQRWFLRVTMHLADTIIVNSNDVREFAIIEEGAPADRIVVIPNGVCVENYAREVDRASLRADLALPPDARLVGCVGRLTWQKGFDVVLRAFSLLPYKNLHLLICGVGEEEAGLRSLAAKLSLGERVHFAGYRRDIPALLGAFDLYVHSARFEGMPNALLEAMAAGCPIVASSVDGNRDLIENGFHGWLVPPEDPAALAEAIEEVLSDPEEARRRGAAARERVVAHYSVDAMVISWEKVLMGHSK